MVDLSAWHAETLRDPPWDPGKGLEAIYCQEAESKWKDDDVTFPYTWAGSCFKNKNEQVG